MFRRICFLLVVTSVFTGCQKILEHIHPHPGGETPSGCKISVIVSANESFIDSTMIQYNDHAQPEAVVYISYDLKFNGYHTHTFNYAYDQLNRIVSQTSDWVYSQDPVYYAYEGNADKPVRDTIPKLFGQVIVEDFGYDASERVIKVVRRTISKWDTDPEEYPTEEYRYTYDQNGNRQEDPSNPHYPGVIEYSDKPSLYSLHPVWQIIHKDYSRNSVLYAEAYNNKGFPVLIKQDPVLYFQPFLNLSPGSGITYICE